MHACGFVRVGKRVCVRMMWCAKTTGVKLAVGWVRVLSPCLTTRHGVRRKRSDQFGRGRSRVSAARPASFPPPAVLCPSSCPPPPTNAPTPLSVGQPTFYAYLMLLVVRAPCSTRSRDLLRARERRPAPPAQHP